MSQPVFTPPQWLTPELLRGMQRGIEKESLRMQANGFLSQQPHPAALGAALTHPHITTDYSESLLELITPPVASPKAALQCLDELHAVVNQALPAGELLWPMSMPCPIEENDELIPLAQYGTSHAGRLKTLYRHGLGLRYGRRMQTIAGIHYNLSFSDALFEAMRRDSQPEGSLADFRDAAYFGLIRNYFRLLPMLIWLTGASPAVCACFVTGRSHHLQRLSASTLYLPFATSLRMGRLGYQNSAQQSLGIGYDSLSAYVAGIRRAVGTPHAAFARLGLDDAQGEPQQINDHVLQLENEYYSPIRPKQITQADETPAQALASRGVAYVELRAVDLDPYAPAGISLATACFLEIFALYCLLMDSPLLDQAETQLLQQQLELVIDQGRDLDTLARQPATASWHADMGRHLQAMQPLAHLLDQANATDSYQQALAAMQIRYHEPAQLPAARLLHAVETQGSLWKVGEQLARQHQLIYAQTVASSRDWAQLAQASRERQQVIEQADQGSFTDYLRRYRVQAVAGQMMADQTAAGQTAGHH